MDDNKKQLYRGIVRIICNFLVTATLAYFMFKYPESKEMETGFYVAFGMSLMNAH